MNNIDPNTSSGLDADLDFTRTIRQAMVNNIIEYDDDGNIIMPADPKERSFLLRALSEWDSVSIARKNIGVAEQANSVAQEAATFLQALHQNMVQTPLKSQTPVNRVIEPDIDVLNTSEVSEYELSQEFQAGQTNYDKFNEQFLEENEEYRDD